MNNYIVKWMHNGIQQSSVCLQMPSASESMAIFKIREQWRSFTGNITIISIEKS